MEPELKRELEGYIDKERSRGFSDDIIKKGLKKAGYKKSEIEPLFVHSMPTKHHSLYIIMAAVIILVLALIFLLPFLMNLTSTQLYDCDTTECFIEYANNCDPAELEINEEGTLQTYQILPGCNFYREYTILAADEPDAIRELLEGKSMTCQYTEGNFDTDLINTVSIGIENCEGDLVDGLEVIILAVA